MPKKSSTKKEEKISESPKETMREKVSEQEFEKKVLELSKNGLTSEKIGEALKKQGIHPGEYSKKISKILGSLYVSPDLANVQSKLDRISRHMEKNRQDKRAMREKDRVFSQVRKIKKYLNA